MKKLANINTQKDGNLSHRPSHSDGNLSHRPSHRDGNLSHRPSHADIEYMEATNGDDGPEEISYFWSACGVGESSLQQQQNKLFVINLAIIKAVLVLQINIQTKFRNIRHSSVELLRSLNIKHIIINITNFQDFYIINYIINSNHPIQFHFYKILVGKYD